MHTEPPEQLNSLDHTLRLVDGIRRLMLLLIFCRVNERSYTTQTSFAFEWAILLFELTIKVKPDYFISYHFLFAAKDSYEVLHCVKLVFSCPVIDSIDLEQIIEHCERFQLDQYVQKLKCLN